MLTLTVILALALDHLLGEPRRLHPLVGFGRLAENLETAARAVLARRGWERPSTLRLAGGFCWCLALSMPLVLLGLLLHSLPVAWRLPADLLVLYGCIGARSLAEHARPIEQALLVGNMAAARASLARIVSRDTRQMNATDIAGGAVESVLENGNDALFGALFWFVLTGPLGAMAYRLANTLDAMWGYRSHRYRQFGWMAARTDDLFNYLPARLCALFYGLAGRLVGALRCWRAQAPLWDSPNAGPVMAAGAGALAVRVGGPAVYHGRECQRPELGEGAPAQAADIGRALQLLWRATACSVLLLGLLEVAMWL